MSRATGSGPFLCLNSVRLFNPITKTNLSNFPKLRGKVLLIVFFSWIFSVTAGYSNSLFIIKHLQHHNRNWLSGFSHTGSTSFQISAQSSASSFTFERRNCAFKPNEATKLNHHRKPILDVWLVHVTRNVT